MDDTYQKSLDLHAQAGGKLEIKSKVPLETAEDLAMAYTPGVAKVSEAVAKDPQSAYIYTIKKNTVAIITDGSAVLGLGNLGPLGAMPVMEGKCVLFKQFSGIDAFPICLDTQDTEAIIQTVKYISPGFGAIQLEDIAAPRCFEIERRLQDELDIPVIHDDQHGTAVVVLAALINAFKLKGIDKQEAKVVVNGAGAAGTAVTKLLLAWGVKHIVVCDSQGIIHAGRSDLVEYKKELALITNPESLSGDLNKALAGSDVFIGLSVKEVLTPELVKTMNSGPIIFALANPVPEIMPDLAKQAGAFIVATGRSDFPNQINNVLAFPGLFRGALDNRVRHISAPMFIRAAENLAACVKDLGVDRILPSVFDPGVALAVASAIKNS